MNDSQVHRGPDEEGIHLQAGIGLGHRRLSIIDLATGQQPLFNEDRSVCVVFNGEIYNYRELVSELESEGHQFRTRSDTEVIVHAWEQWGEQCVTRFRGMFAFAIHDQNQQCLFLARDRLGVKPLFYSVLNDGTVAFASELKALLTLPNFVKQIEPTAVEDYFALGYVPEPRTIYRQAFKVEPATTLRWNRGSTTPIQREYWDLQFPLDSSLSFEESQEELRGRLKESVRLRMIADVPLGAFLSGGVDSSAVVALMAQQSSEPVKTCCIGFSDSNFDESSYARAVAQQYGTEHFERIVDSDDFSLVERLTRLYDEPFADSSAIPTYRVSELARSRVKVALSGDGGDECFGGYRRYRLQLGEDAVRRMLPASLRGGVFRTLAAFYPKADWAPRVFRAKMTFQGLAVDSVEAYCNSVSVLKPHLRQSLYSLDFQKQLNGYRALEVFRRHAQRLNSNDPLATIQYLDMKTYLVGDINTKVDRASMAHSLEVREPLMDHPLIEWMARVPSKFKISGNQGKWLLKKSLEPHLSKGILYRSKMGFSIPLARWFRGPLQPMLTERLLGNPIRESGLFNMSRIEKMLVAHRSGASDFSAPLWSLLMFESFLRQ